MRLETERLVLRPFAVEDLDDYFRLGTRVEVMRYRGLGTPFADREEALATLHRAPLRDYEVHGFGRLACIDKASGAFIGFSGLKYLEDLREVDLGYRFFPEWWGRGYATESSLAVMEYGKSTLGLRRIIGLVDPENIASVRVLVKVGLRFESKTHIDDMGDLDLYAWTAA
jgi:RimJ/RimL family protein N-acetyltransferase